MGDLMQTPATMSSREIADLVESRHDSVKRTIERLAQKEVIQLPPLVEVTNHLGQKVEEYRVGKRDSYVVVAQLSPEFTARLVDRWQELEEGVAQAAPFIPQTLPEALRLAADLAEENERHRAALAVAEPKAAALDLIAEADGTVCITDAAKTLAMRPKDLFVWMRANGWLYRRPGSSADRAFETVRTAGLLRHQLTVPDAYGRTFNQVRVTPAGMAALAQHFAAPAPAIEHIIERA